MTVFGSYQMLKENMVNSIQDHVEDNALFLKYDTLSDLAMIFGQYCSEGQVRRFLEANNNKIMANIGFSSDKVFCKLYYSTYR